LIGIASANGLAAVGPLALGDRHSRFDSPLIILIYLMRRLLIRKKQGRLIAAQVLRSHNRESLMLGTTKAEGAFMKNETTVPEHLTLNEETKKTSESWPKLSRPIVNC